MENQIGPNESRKAPKIALWVTLTVVILIIIAIVLYVGGVFETNTNSNTNTVANTNTETNTNVAVNTNTTVNLNTNTVLNTNSATNTNAPIDTSDWQTYTNTEYGYTAKYPNDWTVEDSTITDSDPLGRELPLRSVKFYSPDKSYLLIVGLQKTSDKGTLNLGGGFGAGDRATSDTITILGSSVNVEKIVYNGKTKNVLYPSPGGTVNIGSYTFGAQFGVSQESGISYDNIDLDNVSETTTSQQILETLTLFL